MKANVRKAPALVVIALAALSVWSIQPASAATVQLAVLSSPAITPAQMLAAATSLEASTMPRVASNEPGVGLFYNYVDPKSGAGLIFPSVALLKDSAPVVTGGVHTNVVVKTRGGYLAFGFNQAEQAALVSGGGAALGAAICILAAPACVVAGIIIAGAVGYPTSRGLCSSNQLLWW